ncbi:MAG: nicotinamide mononucleotide transporter [Firmicutes bacterium]|nr:nicotinamide mononucleotide transporter [Bacillota bacterium]
MKKLLSYFTTYEKIWYVSILTLAFIFAFLFPEEDANGVNGNIIMALYLLDIVLNITCELLISKQSKWNFIVSLGVEAAEIAVCVVCAYRWTTLATTIFFWIPIDIISFINWDRHKDREQQELTEVRRLTGWQEVCVLAGIALWTVVVGGLMVYLTEDILITDFIKDRDVEILICYLDAFVSALSIANGVFIWLRYREQWIAWYAVSIFEGIINILSGQFVLLILKLGYLTNTTYGYIKWTKYIKEHQGKAPASAD